MSQIIRIARTELQLLFYSPIAWLILIVFTIQASLTFVEVLEGFVISKSMGYSLNGVTLGLFTDPFRGFFARLLGYIYFYTPLLTMGMISRELSSGSIKLLYASPVSDRQIIFGKFLAVICYALLMVGIVFCFVIYGASIVDEFDFVSTLPGLLGLLLLICAYGAVGLFMSSLTSYQVVAALGTFAIFAVLNYVNQLWQDVSFVRDIMFWLSMRGRTNEFIGGIIGSEDVIYYLTVIVLFLALTILRFESVRQKRSFSLTVGRYAVVLLAAVFVGYLSSRPIMKVYYDATRTKLRTLTVASQDIVKKVDGKVTMTTYSNALDEDRLLWLGMPRTELMDIDRYKEYLRFKPDLQMNYVRYFAKGNNEASLNQRYPNLSDLERAGKVARSYGMDSTLFRPLDELAPEIREVLAQENHRYVKVLRNEEGKEAIIRVFDDPMLFPSEAEISVAFKRLVDTLPKVGFLEGHGERDCIGTGDRDYSLFARERTFRYSLINQGFDFVQLNLEQAIPGDIQILVISDIRRELPKEHVERLRAYIEAGGNLLIAAEPGREHTMSPILEMLGVSTFPGRIVSPSENYQADMLFAHPTAAAASLTHHFAGMHKQKQVVSMPAALGLRADQAASKNFTVVPLLVADSTGVWNEVETQNYVDEVPVLNAEEGEEELVAVPLALALQRAVGDKDQRIIVLGDADCISNGELNMRRKDIPAANFGVIVGSLSWMANGEVPLHISRPAFTDNAISIGQEGLKWTKRLAVGAVPLLMLFGYLWVWVRRRSK